MQVREPTLRFVPLPHVPRRAALVGLAAAGAVAAWVPFVATPLSPDEGGFLLVGSQWHPGTSLYGHYWVDRPPLLIGLFALAARAGGAVPLRVLGILAVVASVALAAGLARAAAGRVAMTPVVVAAIFLSTPLFGTTEVNGELLAVPAVLLGVLALVRGLSTHAEGRRRIAWCAAAGAAAAAAFLIKQNVVDVLVVAAVLLAQARRGRHGPTLGPLLAVLGGVAVATGACLAFALTRGTSPAMLWDAVVTFRGQAAVVIHSSASSATPDRFVALVGAAALSGAPVVAALLTLGFRRPSTAPSGPPDLRLAAALLLAWECVAVALGGSYWLHYLIGLVPGLVLLAVAAAQRPPALAVRRATAAALAVAVCSAGVATAVARLDVSGTSTDTTVADYLRTHGSQHDSVVVAFGHPNIVWDAGLHSPYDQLWSLPVRVRDPHLQDLRRVLQGPRPPDWIVVSGESLDTWGVTATQAQRVLDRDYHQVDTVGSYNLWRHDHDPGSATSRGTVTVRSQAGRPA